MAEKVKEHLVGEGSVGQKAKSTFREYAEAGGFMSYGLSYRDYYKGVAHYVDKVLRGTKPADLPVQQPTKIELTVNLLAAKGLGITIPQSLLLRADRVIE